MKHPSHMGYTDSPENLFFIKTTATPEFNDRVNETLDVTLEQEFTSQIANFMKQILSFLAQGRSSIVTTLNQTSFSHAVDG